MLNVLNENTRSPDRRKGDGGRCYSRIEGQGGSDDEAPDAHPFEYTEFHDPYVSLVRPMF